MTFTLVFRVLLFCWKLKSKGASHILVLRNDLFVIIWKTNLFKPSLHQYPVLRVFKATSSYTPGHEHQSGDLSHGRHHSYAITNCANRCSSKKGKHKILFNRMLAWPNGNCDFKNCVNILWHLQVDNMIIFYLFLVPEWRGYRHVLKGCQLRPKLCPHAQSFRFDHAKIRAQLINGNLGMCFRACTGSASDDILFNFEFWTQKPLTGFVWCQLHLVINGRFHLLNTSLVLRSAQSCTEKVKGKTDAIHSFFYFSANIRHLRENKVLFWWQFNTITMVTKCISGLAYFVLQCV